MKNLFTPEELFLKGFIEQKGDVLDESSYYRWWLFKKNDSVLDVTYEYNSSDEITNCSINFNSELLNGRTPTKKDIELLIELM